MPLEANLQIINIDDKTLLKCKMIHDNRPAWTSTDIRRVRCLSLGRLSSLMRAYFDWGCSATTQTTRRADFYMYAPSTSGKVVIALNCSFILFKHISTIQQLFT